MKIYLVEDCKNSPGKIYAIFANLKDAENFIHALSDNRDIDADIIERELWYSQPTICGVNK